MPATEKQVQARTRNFTLMLLTGIHANLWHIIAGKGRLPLTDDEYRDLCGAKQQVFAALQSIRARTEPAPKKKRSTYA